MSKELKNPAEVAETQEKGREEILTFASVISDVKNRTLVCDALVNYRARLLKLRSKSEKIGDIYTAREICGPAISTIDFILSLRMK